jgi:superfamily II DNA or RNA helicase
MPAPTPQSLRLLYIIDSITLPEPGGISVDVVIQSSTRLVRPGGRGWMDQPLPANVDTIPWIAVPDADDRRVANLALQPRANEYYLARTAGPAAIPGNFVIRPDDFGTTLAAICETGRAYVRLSSREYSSEPVRWDSGAPWRLKLQVDHAEAPGTFVLTGALVRETPSDESSAPSPAPSETMPLAAPKVLHPAGLLYIDDTLARFDHGGAFFIASTLRTIPRVPLAEGELPELLETLYELPEGSTIALPPDVEIAQQRIPPRPWLSVVPDPSPWRAAAPVLTLGFQYGDVRIAEDDHRDVVFDKKTLMRYERDPELERAARERLLDAGAREEPDFEVRSRRLTMAKGKLAELITELVREGWRVDATGVRYRTPGVTRASVSSGIDWFDLDLVVEYEGVAVPLPTLLDALRKRQSTVTLSDGSVGLLPVEWLSRLGPALAAGSAHANVTRFTRSQVGLLDALLSTLPDVSADETFERARARLHEFAGVTAVDPAPTFVGTLREYQREGLGWLNFLREFHLGGCLADDMGLGKTVQVLALLDALRKQRVDAGERGKPSIIVVPRSLVFNWLREAARFAPKLHVLDLSNARGRLRGLKAVTPAHLAETKPADAVDVIVTTYGMLRRDIAHLRAIEFEYAILDEAQAIKNADTASAKAARLLRARHRLALSGTPIENRLDELWSLFEFLNPGMLGAASAFRLMTDVTAEAISSGTSDDPSGSRQILARALRPVILRRTKEQVAPDLPDRIEQTLLVDLTTPQRKFYLELLERSRRSVFDEVDRVGVGRARMHILEALLRLRQAACAPVLADPSKVHLPSAKLDALVPMLEEIVTEGHKAVVFSQFTSFLALVRERLDAAGLQYEYLDGRTRDREAHVDHFQSAAGPPIFLVSLKAGGHGLNLTAADYVYLLDPWWNPAVEAQAIDRAHRIGQTRHVIATRLVARATIEEKVLELQASKRALADAILGADQGVLAGIGREELEMLLGEG